VSVTTSPLPTPTLGRTTWLNGRLLRGPERGTVDVIDHGLVVGDGVFEALKIVPAGPFAVRRHLDRLSRSAAAMGLPAPDHDQIRAAIDAVVEGRDYDHGKLRITYTAGVGPLGSQAAYGSPTLVVIAEPMRLPPATTAIVTAPWTRNERGALAGVKSTSYAENVRALAYAVDRGAGEAIFPNTVGHLCEGTGTNVFCVFGDRVVTPPLSAGPLAGITRELLLEWCDVEQADLTLDQARAAGEVFITSSLRDLQRVVRWDDRAYADHRVTERLAATFAERSGADLDP
jgi:branched-chain amino acid aminotransferase